MKLDNVIATRPSKKVYRDGDHAIKVFDADYSKADVLNEALNQARVEETGLNIPKVIEVSKIDGKWAITSEYIAGSTLGELMEKNPEKLDEYIEMFVDIQMKIHSKTCPMLGKLKDKMNRKISEADISDTTRYELHARLEGMPKHKKVCHGDLNPTDIIITESGIPYIIDWAHATQGNASADVARSYLMFCLRGRRDIADKYMELFCKKSGTEKKYIQKWLPIVAASQSVKGKPEERDFLHGWIDIMDFE
ncbi:MAG: phosphotransferase [Clostridia bacterium]|nr:phosphotransferase [Clostridia bacterium]